MCAPRFHVCARLMTCVRAHSLERTLILTMSAFIDLPPKINRLYLLDRQLSCVSVILGLCCVIINATTKIEYILLDYEVFNQLDYVDPIASTFADK